MASIFAALENQVSDAVDAVFGELFYFRPMLAGVGGGRGMAPDTTRLEIPDLTGVFDDRTYDSKALGKVERTASQVTLRHVALGVDRRRFGIHPPRQGDLVKRLDTSAVYRITAEPEDSEGRFKLRLVEIGTDL